MQDDSLTLQLPRIGLSQGDFNGIGYEVMLKTFSDARMFETFTPVLYGQSKAFSYYKILQEEFRHGKPQLCLDPRCSAGW